MVDVFNVYYIQLIIYKTLEKSIALKRKVTFAPLRDTIIKSVMKWKRKT